MGRVLRGEEGEVNGKTAYRGTAAMIDNIAMIGKMAMIAK